jgi:hypothetical protein
MPMSRTYLAAIILTLAMGMISACTPPPPPVTADDIVIRDIEDRGGLYFSGIVENRSDLILDKITLTMRYTGTDGVRLGESNGWVDNLEPGQSAAVQWVKSPEGESRDDGYYFKVISAEIWLGQQTIEIDLSER